MPIQDKDLGKYKGPRIYIEEIDASVIELPIQTQLINLIPGFSKKGPVNSPTYITNTTDYNTVFGDIDRQLENKGSYFHRNCIKMLESGPIWALNLLATNDQRDKLQWKSISVSSQYDNYPSSGVRLSPYSRFFNRQDFWERDSESFLDMVKQDDPVTNFEKLLHITNMSNKDITVFMFKSSTTGFDVSAEDWYGGKDKVPYYLNSNDWMSDFLVTVLVVSGNWTDYATLSADLVWSQYFTQHGINKTKIQDFIQEPNVTVKGYNDCSLIPYFKDINNRDMYIMSVLNNNTNRTGLFVTYNEDLVLESDYPNGLMDIIGDTMVGNSKNYINFLSYNEILTENVSYKQKYLDSSNNSFGNGINLDVTLPVYSSSTSYDKRTIPSYTNGFMTKLTQFNSDGAANSNFANYYRTLEAQVTSTSSITFLDGSLDVSTFLFSVNDKVYFNTSATSGIIKNTPYYVTSVFKNETGTGITISEVLGGDPIFVTGLDLNTLVFKHQFILTGNNTYYNVNGTRYYFTGGTYWLDPLVIDSYTNTGVSRIDVAYIDPSDSQVYFVKGTQIVGTGTTAHDFSYAPNVPFDVTNYLPLGMVKLYYTKSGNSYSEIYPINHNISCLNGSYGVSSSGNYPLTTNYFNVTGGDGYVQLNFPNSSGNTLSNDWLKYRQLSVFSELATNLTNSQGVIINLDGTKYPILNPTIVEPGLLSDGVIRFAVSGNYSEYFYDISGLATNLTNRRGNYSGLSGLATNLTNSQGVIINSGGTKLPNVIRVSDIYGSTHIPWLSETYHEICIYYIDDEFVISSDVFSTNNLVTTNDRLESLSADKSGIVAKYSTVYKNYYDGIINTGDMFYLNNDSSQTDKYYINPMMQGDVLFIKFTSTPNPNPPVADMSIDSNTWNNVLFWNSTISIISDRGNWKQSVEIESLGTQNDTTNIRQIWVDASRYPELMKGQFLEAYYNTSDYEVGGDKYGQTPKKLCRIVKSVADINNSSLKILTADAPILIINNGNTLVPDYQTITYPQIDKYVSYYNGVRLQPFVVSQDSIPNNTEARIKTILDVMGKGTNLSKGLANKNKISWRYLVDSFGLGLTDYSKQQYLDLCGIKKNCFAFINMPSKKTFKNSNNPVFVNDDMTVNTSFIKAGGDESKNPYFLYSFGQGIGRSTVGYFFPYVFINDEGIPRMVPPAAWIATTYMQKFLTAQSGIYPWTISAGITNGRVVGITRTEMDFTDDDLDNFYSMGANAITFKAGAGYCIDNESTAQVFPYSSLSLIHSRELLIELENQMYDMLLRYQWKFNTAEIRAEVKFKADRICKKLRDDGGMYAFRNTMDESNNPNYLIDLQIGVIDTEIEIVKGMGIIVNNITIRKKGDIESKGFA